jgi:outer membrane protein OmpA-like peptidoglycan-associated protein
MANRISRQARHSTDLKRPASRAPIPKPIPMLLAAVLVGCASNTHHTTGALKQSQALKPTPAASVPRAEEKPAPLVFKDESGQAHDDGTAPPEKFVDDVEAKQEDEATPDQFTDQTGAAPEEHFVQQPFVDDEIPAKDEGAVAQDHFTDDAGAAKDDGIVAHQQFTDDAAPAKDEDVVAHQRFSDDSAPIKDDDVMAQQRFTDDAPAVKDEAVATEEYTDDSANTAPEQFVPAPEERNVAQAEEPNARPVTMLPMTVTVEADPLFEFDKDSIGADARKKLDQLIQQLNGIPFGEIITLGFADPIGTQAYNQKLSERRAASVERYLVSNGIPADKIRIEARGETEEFASYKSCKGQGRQKLIECLQPDRRVEVTVTTSKDKVTSSTDK